MFYIENVKQIATNAVWIVPHLNIALDKSVKREQSNRVKR